MSSDPYNNDNAGIPTIKRLDDVVVNRIAAGEIIHRPANALKELIENSLDAHSTSIQISVKDGGLKLLQIQDNGHGVKVEDMGIVCERFTTSKLRTFDDLSSMSTYGFRGEALASISHVSHVTITSKIKDSNCAYNQEHQQNPSLVQETMALKYPYVNYSHVLRPDPCTEPLVNKRLTKVYFQLQAEDLFYNVPTRRKALKNPTEEYNRILDIVNRYAIHNAGVSFTCRKVGSNTPDVHTTTSSTVVDNIRQIYGSSVANELLSLKQSFPIYPLKINGWISNANYSVKKFAFLLFINHRSVDSPAIRKAIESVYATYLPKNTHPWVYLSLEMDPKNVDVNVHPTKREVHFMNEEEVIATICDAIQERLGDANVSRNFMTQTLLPQVSVKNRTEELSMASKKPAPKVYEYNQVRTDSRAQTLDSFLVPSSPYSVSATSSHKRVKVGVERMEGIESDDDQEMQLRVGQEQEYQVSGRATDEETNSPGSPSTPSGSLISKIGQFKSNPLGKPGKPGGSPSHGRMVSSSNGQRLQSSRGEILSSNTRTRAPRTDVKLTSVLQLREEVRKQGHPILTPIFANHTFVGILDNQRGLIQNELALYLVNYEAVSEELFYQICLRDFSNFGFIRLSTPVDIKEMVRMALDDEQELMGKNEWPEELKPKDDIAKTVTKSLVGRREMLREYFSICITDQGQLSAIPMMIRGYIPNLEKLPDFLWRLGSEIDWTTEKTCFQTLSRELAIFYSTQPERVEDPFALEDSSDETMEDEGKSPQELQDAHFQHMVSTLVFPAFKRYFIPPKSLIEKSGMVVQVAQVKDLYKVFERC
ncbi:DNA mismatch repair protein [Mortierella polycephala]|uniref:DNA mismatch repair protein n=1 Tax=Mortierella polycephala TaxID=41804 RepID=A0A9P6U658_9FUNG|nr:DNA mismatch repair protein [Mortierella polycephala]